MVSLNSCYKCNIDLTAAFDMVHDPAVALEALISLGFERVLTSGCDSSALEGLPLIKRLIDQVCILTHENCIYNVSPSFSHSNMIFSTQQAKSRIIVMPGE